jgi:recombination protein RecT
MALQEVRSLVFLFSFSEGLFSMANEIAPRSEQALKREGDMIKGQATVKAMIGSPAMKAKFAELLQERASGFLCALGSLAANGDISRCNPGSVIAAAFVAASLDLPINKELGLAWIVPYKGFGQFQLGYKGYVQLALRTGQYERMNAFVVNKECVCGYDEVGEPVIDFNKLDRSKEVYGYAFAFKLSNNFTKVAMWTKEEVTDHMVKFSKGYKGKDSPWQTSFDAMGLKTVTANTLKRWGPLSVQLQTAMFHDQGVQTEIGGEVNYIDNPGRNGPGMSVADIEGLLEQSYVPSEEAGTDGQPS